MENKPPETYIKYTSALLAKHHEYADVYSFVFAKPEGFVFEAGQYVHVRLVPPLPPEEKSVREFSFASAPSDESLMFTIETGSGSAYMKRMMNLIIGEEVELFKIKRHIGLPTTDIKDMVMIGGGIGVTPFRSILREIVARNLILKPTLIHVSSGDYLYEKELSQLPFTQLHVSREEVGSVLARTTKEQVTALYLIAGSHQFIEHIVQLLLSFGISRESIQTDEFKGLLDEVLA